jgi:hypothetical protein
MVFKSSSEAGGWQTQWYFDSLSPILGRYLVKSEIWLLNTPPVKTAIHLSTHPIYRSRPTILCAAAPLSKERDGALSHP